MGLPFPVPPAGQLLLAAGLPPAVSAAALLDDGVTRVDRLRLEDGETVLLDPGPIASTVLATLRAGGHEQAGVLASCDEGVLRRDEPFDPIGATSDPDAWEAVGRALGELHAALKGQTIALELHDATWFSRAAPYVMAEVASMAERGEYALTLPELGRLEEAGVLIAELSEPLTGLLPTLVHGNLTAEHAGLQAGSPAFRGWGAACSGLGWLDLAALARDAERAGSEPLVSLVRSYATSAGYEPALVGDLVPFCGALHDLYVLDRWNRELAAGARPSGSLREAAERRTRRLLDLAGA